ncbi:hydrolase, alpha/beta domain protein, partial [Cooperia oncophora]
MDHEYRHFINVWLKAKGSGKSEDNQALKRYDFDLEGVNADFHAVRNENLYFHRGASGDSGPLVMCAAWYAVHAFGRHMLYPGSVSLLNWLLSGSLLQARNLMVSAKHGKRAWLRSTEGDLIDTMYIRGEETPEHRNRILVISCEGNAGYYEIGIANTPAQMGYSVLGWNQPGFGQSSGLPFPNNTLAAADAVMQYAQSELGYREQDIVLFGWSIGGFPASWLAANYPKVRAVILDATFDDVLPLAQARMPKVLSDIVEYAIRTHFDLNIKSIIAKYKGPLKLIRRLQEEILTTDDTGTEAQRRASNRANFLLKGVLQQRHPKLMVDLDSQVDRWLAMSPQHRALAAHPKNDAEIAIRRARLFAACDHYLTDFDATHVQPLDPG